MSEGEDTRLTLSTVLTTTTATTKELKLTLYEGIIIIRANVSN